jgi:hypothetical protein
MSNGQLNNLDRRKSFEYQQYLLPVEETPFWENNQASCSLYPIGFCSACEPPSVPEEKREKRKKKLKQDLKCQTKNQSAHKEESRQESPSNPLKVI